MIGAPEGTQPAAGGDETGARASSAAERATTGGSVMAGGLWSTASRLVPQLYTLAISVAAGRYLGPQGFGRQSFIAFAAVSLTTLLTAGFDEALMRYSAVALGERRPALLRTLVAWLWGLEAIGALLGGGILLGVGLGGAEPRSAWLLAGLATSLGILHAIPAALLMGTQRWRGLSLIGLASGAVSTGATIAVLAAGGGITGMFAVEAATALLNLLLTVLLARRALGDVAPRDLQPAALMGERRREVARYAAYSWVLIVVSLVVWSRSEFLFLDHYSSNTQIALYSIAFAATNALILVPRGLAQAISPAFATLYGAGALERMRSGYGRALRLMTMMSLPLTAGMMALGPAAVRVFYGSDYRAAGPLIVIMAAVLPIVPLRNTSNSLVSAFGRVRLQAGVGLLATAINLVADFVLIPAHGAVGAAIANALAQVSGSLAILVFGLGLIGRIRWEAGALLRTATASAAAGVIAWATTSLVGGGLGLALGLLVGLLAFALLAALLRILPEQDGAWLQELAGGRLRGLLRPACQLCTARPAHSS